jgi:hypothetical protein
MAVTTKPAGAFPRTPQHRHGVAAQDDAGRQDGPETARGKARVRVCGAVGGGRWGRLRACGLPGSGTSVLCRDHPQVSNDQSSMERAKETHTAFTLVFQFEVDSRWKFKLTAILRLKTNGKWPRPRFPYRFRDTTSESFISLKRLTHNQFKKHALTPAVGDAECEP